MWGAVAVMWESPSPVGGGLFQKYLTCCARMISLSSVSVRIVPCGNFGWGFLVIALISFFIVFLSSVLL